MIPSSFKESNAILDSDMEGIDPLSVCVAVDENNTPVIISKWKLTEEELKFVLEKKYVYVVVLGHEGQPPMLVHGEELFDDKD